MALRFNQARSVRTWEHSNASYRLHHSLASHSRRWLLRHAPRCA